MLKLSTHPWHANIWRSTYIDISYLFIGELDEAVNSNWRRAIIYISFRRWYCNSPYTHDVLNRSFFMNMVRHVIPCWSNQHITFHITFRKSSIIFSNALTFCHSNFNSTCPRFVYGFGDLIFLFSPLEKKHFI